MILGTKARYAVMAMVELAACDRTKPTRLREISDRQEIPLAYLEQIFSLLRQQGLVLSVKGPGGGYTLARERNTISIAQVVEAVEEPTKMTRCEAHSHAGCMASKTRCLTHDLWEGLEVQINQYMSGISLEDVCTRKKMAKSLQALAIRDYTISGAAPN
jgi:Rrf2 family transcriptional regulator, iron-sulfur cluster assembly transcription factor